MTLLAAKVRGGDLQQGKSADREDDHPDGVHDRHPARRTGGPKPGERHVTDRPDDVLDRTRRPRSAHAGDRAHRRGQAVGVETG